MQVIIVGVESDASRETCLDANGGDEEREMVVHADEEWERLAMRCPAAVYPSYRGSQEVERDGEGER